MFLVSYAAFRFLPIIHINLLSSTTYDIKPHYDGRPIDSRLPLGRSADISADEKGLIQI